MSTGRRWDLIGRNDDEIWARACTKSGGRRGGAWGRCPAVHREDRPNKKDGKRHPSAVALVLPTGRSHGRKEALSREKRTVLVGSLRLVLASLRRFQVQSTHPSTVPGAPTSHRSRLFLQVRVQSEAETLQAGPSPGVLLVRNAVQSRPRHGGMRHVCRVVSHELCGHRRRGTSSNGHICVSPVSKGRCSIQQAVTIVCSVDSYVSACVGNPSFCPLPSQRLGRASCLWPPCQHGGGLCRNSRRPHASFLVPLALAPPNTTASSRFFPRMFPSSTDPVENKLPCFSSLPHSSRLEWMGLERS